MLGTKGQKRGLVTQIYDLICCVILFNVNMELFKKKTPNTLVDFLDKNKYEMQDSLLIIYTRLRRVTRVYCCS